VSSGGVVRSKDHTQGAQTNKSIRSKRKKRISGGVWRRAVVMSMAVIVHESVCVCCRTYLSHMTSLFGAVKLRTSQRIPTNATGSMICTNVPFGLR
jgi:hypothetical protein